MKVRTGVFSVQIDRLDGNFHYRNTVSVTVQQHIHFVFIPASLCLQHIVEQRKVKGAQSGLCIGNFGAADNAENGPGYFVPQFGAQRDIFIKVAHPQNKRTRMKACRHDGAFHIFRQVLTVRIHRHNINCSVFQLANISKRRFQRRSLSGIFNVMQDNHAGQII